MKKLLTLALALLLGNLASMAVPAYPAKRTVKLADGSVITATLKGDEFMHYYQTEDGRNMRLEGENLVPISDFDFALMMGEAQQRSSVNQQRRVASKIKRNTKYTGQKRGLVILVEFADNEFSVPTPQKTYEDYFNKSGYTDYGMTGSVSDYFKAQSYGAFELCFDVVGPYKLSRNMKGYGAIAGEAHDYDPGGMAAEAVTMANADVNYRNYDWDQDGGVDQVFIIYAGYGENYGASSDCIWPHESNISHKNLVFDGTRIGTYACSCELRGISGTNIDGIGAACHEFSHCLGIMDHYDTQGNNFGMGTWDVMCSGSYNNNSCTPTAYTAYERWVSGWLEPVEITEKTQITGMKPLVEAPEAYILYNEGNRDEYYLLENRQQRGFDAGLYGHGLLVVHVDYSARHWETNAINVGDVQHMKIIAADNEYSGYTNSLAGDPFPGSKGVTSLLDYTTPAATVHNKNKDKTFFMHKGIECIKEDVNGNISMLVCAKPLEAPTFDAPSEYTSTSFRLSWNKVEDAESYEIYLDEVAKKASVADALIVGEDFSSCYSKSAGFTDISSKDMGKYLPGWSGSRLFTTPDYLRIGTGTSTGYLRTPVFQQLSTGDLTIVLKAKPYKTGSAVKGEVKIVTNTASTNQTFALNIEEETTLVFHSYVQFTEIFRVDVMPSSAMYISGLYLYDGNFTDAELGLNSSTKAPRRVHVNNYTTTNTYYDFTNLNPNSQYSVKIRALAPDRSSEWSEMFTITDPTAIVAPFMEKMENGNVWYDLSGRRVDTPSRGLYIKGGKKILIK